MIHPADPAQLCSGAMPADIVATTARASAKESRRRRKARMASGRRIGPARMPFARQFSRSVALPSSRHTFTMLTLQRLAQKVCPGFARVHRRGGGRLWHRRAAVKWSTNRPGKRSASPCNFTWYAVRAGRPSARITCPPPRVGIDDAGAGSRGRTHRLADNQSRAATALRDTTGRRAASGALRRFRG